MDRSSLVRTEDISVAAPLTGAYLGVALVLVYIIKVLLLGRIFKKAGQSSWKAWVPFVNTWTYFKIGGYKGANLFWLLGALVAFAVAFYVDIALVSWVAYGIGSALALITAIFGIAASISIQKKLGKPLPFILLLFINLVVPLWIWILALDYSKWNNKVGHGAKKAVSKKKK
jgi:hypothetical protein